MLEVVKLSSDELRRLYEKVMQDEILSKYHFPQTPSSDGFYHIYVRDSTKKSGRKAVKAKTLEELKEKVYRHEQGIDGTARKKFKDVFIIVAEQKMAYVKDAERALSVKNTIGKNKSDYRRFFQGTAFENLYIDEIKAQDIENICMANLQKYSLNKKAFLAMRGIIKNVCSVAMSRYWIWDNPYLHADFAKFKYMTVESVQTKERVHSDEEIKKMLDYIHEHQRKYPTYLPSYALELQITMGLRRGEIPPLEWADIYDGEVHINKQQITIKKTADNKEYWQIVHHTKTWKDRSFPVIPEVESILKRLKFAHTRANLSSPYLFPAKSKTGVITNNTVYNFYRRMCRALDIEICAEVIKGTHSFRRNAITQVINQTGGNIILASELFGNSPDVAFKNYYTQTSKQAKVEALTAGNQQG